MAAQHSYYTLELELQNGVLSDIKQRNSDSIIMV